LRLSLSIARGLRFADATLGMPLPSHLSRRLSRRLSGCLCRCLKGAVSSDDSRDHHCIQAGFAAAIAEARIMAVAFTGAGLE
jgi:hypothetical protein